MFVQTLGNSTQSPLYVDMCWENIYIDFWNEVKDHISNLFQTHCIYLTLLVQHQQIFQKENSFSFGEKM